MSLKRSKGKLFTIERVQRGKKVDWNFTQARNRGRLSIFPQIYRAKLIQIAAPKFRCVFASSITRGHVLLSPYRENASSPPPLLLLRGGEKRTRFRSRTTSITADKSVQQPRTYPPPLRKMLYVQNVGQPRRIGAQTG